MHHVISYNLVFAAASSIEADQLGQPELTPALLENPDSPPVTGSSAAHGMEVIFIF